MCIDPPGFLSHGVSHTKSIGLIERRALDWNYQGNRRRRRPIQTYRRTVTEKRVGDQKDGTE